MASLPPGYQPQKLELWRKGLYYPHYTVADAAHYAEIPSHRKLLVTRRPTLPNRSYTKLKSPAACVLYPSGNSKMPLAHSLTPPACVLYHLPGSKRGAGVAEDGAAPG